MQQRYLIVNADDFGQSPGVNRGIIAAHEYGIVTSASLMVRGQAAAAAARAALEHPQLSLGLHIDLGEWAYRDGTWICLYQVVALNDAQAVADEIARQLQSFYDLVGYAPTHLDSHQHVHREQPARDLVLEHGRCLGIPVRGADARIHYCGAFYGQTGKGDSHPKAIGSDNLFAILAGLPCGYTELGCHPSAADDLDSMYRAERLLELDTLCQPELRAALQFNNIRLCSFRDLRS